MYDINKVKVGDILEHIEVKSQYRILSLPYKYARVTSVSVMDYELIYPHKDKRQRTGYFIPRQYNHLPQESKSKEELIIEKIKYLNIKFLERKIA